jgi:hypothetical protein
MQAACYVDCQNGSCHHHCFNTLCHCCCCLLRQTAATQCCLLHSECLKGISNTCLQQTPQQLDMPQHLLLWLADY